jgi:hypothetical protein
VQKKKKVREWSAHVAGKELWYTHFTRFTGAKVQILTQKALLGRANWRVRANPLSQSPCPLRLSACACVYVCNARQHTSAYISITSALRRANSHRTNPRSQSPCSPQSVTPPPPSSSSAARPLRPLCLHLPPPMNLQAERARLSRVL